MQGVKDLSIYSQFSTNKSNDARLRRDLKKHNWLLMKLENKQSKEILVKKKKQKISNKKSKPVVPVCLPVTYYQKYLRKMECKENDISKGKFEKDFSNTNIFPIIRSLSSSKRSISMNINNDKSTTGTSILSNRKKTDCNKTTETIETNTSVDDTTVPVKRLLPKYDKYLTIPGSSKLDITKIPLPLQVQSTQTDEIPIVDREDQELLRIVKIYGFTVDDLERFYQNSLKDNNNGQDFQNLNLLDGQDGQDDQDDEDESRLIIAEDNVNMEIENTPDTQLDHNTNKLHLQNTNLHTVSQNDNKDDCVSSNDTFTRLKVCSDLNKIVLSSFYEAVLFKNNDKADTENELSQLSQALVEKIYEVFESFSKNNVKLRAAPEIIVLDDCDECEVLPRKRLAKIEHEAENRQMQVDYLRKQELDDKRQIQVEQIADENHSIASQKSLPIPTQQLSQKTNLLRKFRTQNIRRTPPPMMPNPPTRMPYGYKNEASLSGLNGYPIHNTLYQPQYSKIPTHFQGQSYHHWTQNPYPYSPNFQVIPQIQERLDNRTFEIMMQERDMLYSRNFSRYHHYPYFQRN